MAAYVIFDVEIRDVNQHQQFMTGETRPSMPGVPTGCCQVALARSWLALGGTPCFSKTL